MRAAGALFVACVLGCSPAATPPTDGGPTLRCEPPLSIAMVPSASTSLPDAPVAAITWTDDECRLVTDEDDPDIVLLVADFHGTVLEDLTAIGENGWGIESSSHATPMGSYVAGLPYDEDITLELVDDDQHLHVVFRVEPAPGTIGTVVLVAMTLR